MQAPFDALGLVFVMFVALLVWSAVCGMPRAADTWRLIQWMQDHPRQQPPEQEDV